MLKSKTLVALALASAMLVGCANQSARPDVYNRSELQKAQYTSFGTIKSLKPIVINDDGSFSSTILTVAGTAIGAIAGSHVGGGTGAVVSSIVGGLAGGYATNAVANNTTVTQSNGVEFTIQADNGKMLTFAQQGDITKYQVGQRVKLVTAGDGTTRVDTH